MKEGGRREEGKGREGEEDGGREEGKGKKGGREEKLKGYGKGRGGDPRKRKS